MKVPDERTAVAVVGAGQAGLSSAYFLGQRGFVPHEDFVVLDANPSPGGAWQHRWSSLTMEAVHGVHDLPGLSMPDSDPQQPAREVMADYFARYERTFALPVRRPVAVDSVREAGDGRLVVDTDDGVWETYTLINATGTWTRPFWPTYPGMDSFRGRQLHAADYRAAGEFAGQHVVVVGGGHSAIQLLAELSGVATTTWVTRRPPVWRDTPFDQRQVVRPSRRWRRRSVLGADPTAS